MIGKLEQVILLFIGITLMKLNGGVVGLATRNNLRQKVSAWCLGNSWYLEELYAGRIPGTKYFK
jgi:hypothetical protein